jgi:hypothetical protein
MFGLTAGAVWVYFRSVTYHPQQLPYHLSVASLGFALATVFALLVQMTIVTSLPAFVVWAEFAAALAVPFFFAGITVSLALTRSPYPVGIVYGADLLGAAFGCLGALKTPERRRTCAPSASSGRPLVSLQLFDQPFRATSALRPSSPFTLLDAALQTGRSFRNRTHGVASCQFSLLR